MWDLPRCGLGDSGDWKEERGRREGGGREEGGRREGGGGRGKGGGRENGESREGVEREEMIDKHYLYQYSLSILCRGNEIHTSRKCSTK